MPSPRHYLPGPLLAALLLGCGESNFEPVAPRPLDPPHVYQIWWSEVEACIGTRASFERVRWYQADNIVDTDAGTEHDGAWYPPHTIYIRSDRLSYTKVIKHEMVHDLLQRRDHDSLFFRACAGL